MIMIKTKIVHSTPPELQALWLHFVNKHVTPP
jgi:hypothetical protein